MLEAAAVGAAMCTWKPLQSFQQDRFEFLLHIVVGCGFRTSFRTDWHADVLVCALIVPQVSIVGGAAATGQGHSS